MAASPAMLLLTLVSLGEQGFLICSPWLIGTFQFLLRLSQMIAPNRANMAEHHAALLTIGAPPSTLGRRWTTSVDRCTGFITENAERCSGHFDPAAPTQRLRRRSAPQLRALLVR